MKKLFTLISVVICTVISLQSCSNSDKNINQEDLKGNWILTSLQGEAATDAFKGNIPSLTFNFDDNMISGTGGCNRYSGAFTLEGNKFLSSNLASTRMLCAEENKEDLFIQTLTTKEGLLVSVKDGILTFKTNDNIVLEFKKEAE